MKLLLFAVLLWAIFGTPLVQIADWFWGDVAAPWEEVDAFYYPDRHNLLDYEAEKGFNSVDVCRIWVATRATVHGDPEMMRGDYECAIEQLDGYNGLSVYRATVR